MAERFDGAIEALGAPILWVSLSLAAVVLGATASAFSALYDTEVDAGETGTEPPPESWSASHDADWVLGTLDDQRLSSRSRPPARPN